jgi:hypothetical protein
MDKQIKQFEVSSPDELREALASCPKDGARWAAVRVLGQNILTRQFNFPKSSTQELITGLKLEASETLSVPAADVELVYQITGTDKKGMHGIFSAISRQLLAEYQDCFKKHPLFPISLTASSIGAVIDFLKDQPLAGNNFCLVNFLKHHAVNIIIFANAKPVFFRELDDLNESDFKDKIADTIRYSCRNSAAKSIDHVFFTGDLTGKEDLMKSLKELENPSPAEILPAKDAPRADLAGLNLLSKYVLGPAERGKLVFIFSFMFVVFILFGFLLAWRIDEGYIKLYEVKSKVNTGDYYQALDLQKELRHLDHEK